MYTGDGKPAISITADAQPPDTSGSNPNTLHNLEAGAAVEVLELANGETIWSIVNGLRDDDEESFYGNRASFVFFSSSAQIGRLIDSLSHGTEAGSFNILPTTHNPTSIHSDSAHWTVEERLEHMLNSLGTS
ncbi:hypothetical protein B0F90DRAFT_1809676 [Multifurca ochricompacta]|uniref:Uncharacterized protein n=1 Tax=Multifurca ochricompacta TaxID=376703 RepID=A0AAD4M7H3_9AGAM|nr:hypothetical protein B0F90DRAFT_1809676 [Multifurca ochricompacta]